MFLPISSGNLAFPNVKGATWSPASLAVIKLGYESGSNHFFTRTFLNNVVFMPVHYVPAVNYSPAGIHGNRNCHIITMKILELQKIFHFNY